MAYISASSFNLAGGGNFILTQTDKTTGGYATRAEFNTHIISSGTSLVSMITSATSTKTRWLTLSNGSYIDTKYYQRYGSMYGITFYLYSSTNQLIYEATQALAVQYCTMAFEVDNEEHRARFVMCDYNRDGALPFGMYANISGSDVYNWALGSWEEPVEHTYHAIPSLTNGSQAFALTTISDTYIGETATTFPVEAVTSWSVQSKFNDYLINKKESGRYSKMFELSADKYIGLACTNYSIDEQQNEAWIGEVRFYNNGTYNSTLSLPFTVNAYGGEINAYLTLALDSDNHCIKPTVVRKVANTLVFNDETYTDAQQEALYTYLSSFIGSETGGAGNTPTSDGESGGGGGWYMPDDIDGVPSLPQVSVIDGGMVSLYKLTSSQLDGLADYLWSDDFLDNIKKFFNDPMEMIISLRAYPFTVSAGIDTTIKAGNITTTVHGDKLTGSTQFARIDCGEVTVFPRTKTYRDYSPYTSASIFLPFVGTRPIDIDLIIDKRVGVQYNVDLFSGQAICFVTINGNVMYQYECSLGCSIPISSQSYSNIMGSVTSALTIPFNPVGGVTGVSEGFKPAISRSGSFSGYGGMLGSLKPKIYFEYAQFIEAKNQEEEYGKPSHKRIKLDNCDGYTEVDEIHLEGTTALADEVDELYKILKGGFIA